MKKYIETCCVADQCCIAVANFYPLVAAKGECFCCGQKVCSKCSSIRKYLHYGKVRLCNDCQVQYDGDEKLVMKRLYKMVNQ